MLDKRIERHDNIWVRLVPAGTRHWNNYLRLMTRQIELELVAGHAMVRRQQHIDLLRTFRGP